MSHTENSWYFPGDEIFNEHENESETCHAMLCLKCN